MRLLTSDSTQKKRKGKRVKSSYVGFGVMILECLDSSSSIKVADIGERSYGTQLATL